MGKPTTTTDTRLLRNASHSTLFVRADGQRLPAHLQNRRNSGENVRAPKTRRVGPSVTRAIY